MNFYKDKKIYSFDCQNNFNQFYTIEKVFKKIQNIQKEECELKCSDYYTFKEERFNVIFSGKSAGFVIHEIIGHLSEIGTERIKWWKPGTKLFDSSFNVIDNPTLYGMVGSYPFDDEGIEAKEKYLIKDGYVNELLNSTYYTDSSELNGSARCDNFRNFPKPRMSNTYLLEGNYSKKDLISGLNKYVYMESIIKGGVNYKTEMVYLLGKAILYIDNIKYCIGDVIIADKLETFIGNIQCIGRNLEFENSSWCIKYNEVIPVKYGSPELRIDNLNVFQLKYNYNVSGK